MTAIGRLMLTCFGLGRLRPAPGTWGSLPPVVMSVMLVIGLNERGSAAPMWIVNGALLIVAAVFSWACIRFGAAAELQFGRKDPGQVVADEVAGQCVSLLFLPWRWSNDAQSIQLNLGLAAAAFLLFRALDILKPPPANNLQKLSAGLGILIDDLIVGVYAAVILQFSRLLLAH